MYIVDNELDDWVIYMCKYLVVKGVDYSYKPL